MNVLEKIEGIMKWGTGPAGKIQRNFEKIFSHGLSLTDLRGHFLNDATPVDFQAKDPVTFTTADTSQTFPHSLGRTPIGFIQCATGLAGDPVRGLPDGSATNQGAAWDADEITLVATVNTQVVLIYVF